MEALTVNVDDGIYDKAAFDVRNEGTGVTTQASASSSTGAAVADADTKPSIKTEAHEVVGV